MNNLNNNSKKALSKIALITITIILLFSNLTMAEDVILQETNTQIANQINAEHVRTRSELTTYTDRKINEMITIVKTDGQAFIDENFRVFDNRIQQLAVKIHFIFAITIITSIIIAQATWYFIKKQIEKKAKPTPTTLRKDLLTADKYGLISPTYQKKISTEEQTKEEPLQLTESNETTPISPQINQLEAMLKQMKEARALEQEKKAFEKATKEYRKQEQENKKKIERIKKLEEKAAKKTKNISQEINKLQQEINPLPPPRRPEQE